jgi:hypothetical protein
MIFLPIAFYCYVNGACVFNQGQLTMDITSCTAQNAVAERLMQADANVQAFKTTCIVIEPKDAGSTDV